MNFNRESMIEFLKEHLSITVWCDYDGCGSYTVNASLFFDGEEISTSSDYLPNNI